MNKLLLLSVFALIAVVAAQWNNNPNNGQLPNFPQIDCNAPGTVCETKEMVCDGRGNCKEKSSRNGSTASATVSVVLLMSCGVIATIKNYL